MDYVVNKVIRIGLTGGIGSGKTTVAGMLSKAGALVLDADATAHQLTQANGAAMPSILRLFGAAYVDKNGVLNRTTMRDLVFNNPLAKEKLEQLMHPLIQSSLFEMERMALTDITVDKSNTNDSSNETPQRTAIVVYDLPLLAESVSWQNAMNVIWVVDCSEQLQIQRVLLRGQQNNKPITANVAQSIINQQASRAQRLSIADVVVDNGDGIGFEQLQHQITCHLQQHVPIFRLPVPSLLSSFQLL